MILDTQLLFSEDQAITATAISTNVIRLNAMGTAPGNASALSPRNLGAGTYVPLLMQVTEGFNLLTSVTVTLETSAAAALTAPVILWSSGAIPLASLIAGFRFGIRVLPDAALLEYLGLRYTVAGVAATLGKITAALATEVQS